MIKHSVIRLKMYYAESTRTPSIKGTCDSSRETSNQADCFFLDQIHGGSDNSYATAHVKLTEENR